MNAAAKLGDTIALWKKTRKVHTLNDAWDTGNAIKVDSRFTGIRRKKYGFIHATLECAVCCRYGSHIIPVGDKNYLVDSQRTKRWWDLDFISGFGALVAHEAHLDSHLQPHPSTQFVHCHYPNAIPGKESCISLAAGKERIVSVLHNGDHYVVLVVEVEMKKAFIYDGLRRSLVKYQKHLLSVLRCTSFVQRVASCRYDVSEVGKRVDKVMLAVDSQQWELK